MRARAFTVEISISGLWHEDEAKMLGEGIGIRVV